MCVYVYNCVYAHICIFDLYICFVFVCVIVYTCLCMCVCVFIIVYIHILEYLAAWHLISWVYICMRIYIYTCVYIYIYTRRQKYGSTTYAYESQALSDYTHMCMHGIYTCVLHMWTFIQYTPAYIHTRNKDLQKIMIGIIIKIIIWSSIISYDSFPLKMLHFQKSTKSRNSDSSASRCTSSDWDSGLIWLCTEEFDFSIRCIF